MTRCGQRKRTTVLLQRGSSLEAAYADWAAPERPPSEGPLERRTGREERAVGKRLQHPPPFYLLSSPDFAFWLVPHTQWGRVYWYDLWLNLSLLVDVLHIQPGWYGRKQETPISYSFSLFSKKSTCNLFHHHHHHHLLFFGGCGLYKDLVKQR